MPPEGFNLHAFAFVWLAIYSLLVEYNAQFIIPTSVVNYLAD